ncbi:CT620/CT621 family type III secretion system effector [Chlamydiifrater phoenicopteri]|uniref:CT620/CT621 family type III secretion system effector n=1 Tax=Chlamydiifrater phoenicopteri TaxID=2681469 RepID=UPI001BD153D1|nr:CT620/CT621 family type III secretion system effector [Chlamydiifrater phoenicopteri]
MLNKTIFINPKKEIAIAFQKNTINKQSFLSDTIKFETILQEKHFLNKLAHVLDGLVENKETVIATSNQGVEVTMDSAMNAVAPLSKKRFCVPRYYSSAKPSSLKPLQEGRYPVKVPRTRSEEEVSRLVDDNQQCLTRAFLDGLVEILQKCEQPKQDNTELFSQLLEKANSLKEKRVGYTVEDMISTRNLSWETVEAIGRSDLDEARKVTLMSELSLQYENITLLEGSYARSRARELLRLLSEIKERLEAEEYSIFAEIERKIFAIDNQVENYSSEDIENVLLYTLEFSETINRSALPRGDKIDYNRKVMTVYNEQVESLEVYQKVVEASIAAREHQLEIFRQVTNQTAAFFGLFAPINLTNSISDFTASGASAALQALFAIDSMFSYLSEEQKSLVNNAFNEAFSLSSTAINPRIDSENGISGEGLGNTDFPWYIAIVWTYFLASNAIAKNPSISQTAVNTAVKTGVGDFQDSGFDMLKAVKGVVEKIALEADRSLFADKVLGNGVAVLPNKAEYTVYSQGSDNSTVTINFTLMDIGGTFLSNWNGLFQNAKNEIAQKYFRFKGLSHINFTEEENKLSISRENLKELASLEQNVYVSGLVAKTGELQALALPSAVATVLIDHYMPREVDFLNDAYSQLYFSNFASTVGNAILEVIASFVNSATYFNFASYIGQKPAVGTEGKDIYPGNFETAERKLREERLQATLFLQKTEAGLEEIEKQLAIVDADEKISLTQRTQLRDMLTSYAISLRGIANNLVTVSNFLSQITVSKAGEKELPGTFQVKGPDSQWQNNLENMEEAVVSGFSGQILPNGMFSLHALVQSDQQSFADMGQNHQLNLQMHLTGMQQEWTVISTSLQILNQVYLGLVRSLLG